MLGTGLGPAFGEALRPSRVDWRSDEQPIAVMPTLMDARCGAGCPADYGSHARRLVSELGLEKFAEYFSAVAGSVFLEPQLLYNAQGIGRLAFLRFRVWVQETAPFDVLVSVLIDKAGNRAIIDIGLDLGPGPGGHGGGAGAARARCDALVEGEIASTVVQLQPNAVAAVLEERGLDGEDSDGAAQTDGGGGHVDGNNSIGDALDLRGAEAGTQVPELRAVSSDRIESDGGATNRAVADGAVVHNDIDNGEGNVTGNEGANRGVGGDVRIATDGYLCRKSLRQRFMAMQLCGFASARFRVAGLSILLACVDMQAARVKRVRRCAVQIGGYVGVVTQALTRLRSISTPKKSSWWLRQRMLTSSSTPACPSERARDVFISYKRSSKEIELVRDHLKGVTLFIDSEAPDAGVGSNPVRLLGDAITRTGGVAVIFLGMLSTAEVDLGDEIAGDADDDRS